MPKKKKYISTNAKCPYYKCQERQKIYCVGVQPDSAIVLTFSYPGDRVSYQDEYCMCAPQECKLYHVLEE